MKLKVRQPEEELPPQGPLPPPEGEPEKPLNYDDDGEDPLKRANKFTWKSFGGDSFLISVIFHGILIIFALFYVVATIQPKEPEPQEFVSGAGGGSDGDNANRQQRRMRQKPREMNTQNKITSKSTRAKLTLPEMPKMNTSNLGALSSMKNSGGGASSGTGGGIGGGVGKGFGPGIGNGSAFLSMFGTKGPNIGGISGNFYDLKLTDKNAPSGMNKDKYLDVGFNVIRKKGSWNESPLKGYFKADTTLSMPAQIFIPAISADDAPKAFDLTNAGRQWMIHYKGSVRANKSGKIRLIGIADDFIAVRLGETLALDAGMFSFTEKSRANERLGVSSPGKRDLIPSFDGYQGRTTGMYTGPVITVKKDATLQFECIIGELPGGAFSAALLFEELDKHGEVVGKPKLFRFSKDPIEKTVVPEILKNPNWNTWNNAVDMTGGGWAFVPVKRGNPAARR